MVNRQFVSDDWLGWPFSAIHIGWHTPCKAKLVTAGKAGRHKVQGVSTMFNTTDIRRNVVAALGAILVSFTIMGASIGPVELASPAIASSTSA